MFRGMAALSVALGALGSSVPVAPALAGAAVGQPAPALVAQELDGGRFDLHAQLGKVVVVNFWATWCPPCRQEMPVLDALYAHDHGRGLEMIGMSVGSGRARERDESRETMKPFRYPAAMLSDAAVDGFGAPDKLPVTYIVDREGIVRARMTAGETPVTEQDFASVIDPLLTGESPAPSLTPTRVP